MKTQSISRRVFLKTSATAATTALAASTPKVLFAADSYGGNKIPFGLQLYSVRNECAKDLDGTVTAVATAGERGENARSDAALGEVLKDNSRWHEVPFHSAFFW